MKPWHPPKITDITTEEYIKIMDDKMRKALEADGEKLRQLTGEDHGPYFWENNTKEEDN